MAASDSDFSSVQSTAASESLLCPLCLDVFITPKFLTCHHTFCQACLQDLVGAGPPDRVLCPSCRKETLVPPGGVTALQTNFYIEEDLSMVRSRKSCSLHPKREAEVYCVECNTMMCVMCLVTQHQHHEAMDISSAKKRFRAQLAAGKARLAGLVDIAKRNVEEAKLERQAIVNKKAAVKSSILSRHQVLRAAIDKYRDEALVSLDSISGEMLAVQDVVIVSRQEQVDNMVQLHQEVNHALDTDNVTHLMTVATNLRCGRISKRSVQKLLVKQTETVCRPVLLSGATPGITLQRVRDYVGSAAKMEMVVSAPEVTVVEQFRRQEYPDADIYHVCPMTNDNVVLSLESCMLENPAYAEFNATGELIGTLKYSPSKITHVRLNNDTVAHSQCTYAKNCDPSLIRFLMLENMHTGIANVYLHQIVSEGSLTTETERLCTIKCNAHRAFDVNDRGKFLVVVQEPQTPDTQRKVLLYRRGKRGAIATYSPPAQPFQPSDVCFYTLGGQEVLLVADELNDAIHVVNVHKKRLKFARYLSPGCPLLLQPTALNVDMRGRLWVACRGGRILTCTPTQTVHALELETVELPVKRGSKYTESWWAFYRAGAGAL